ncbi:DUF2637 domain-containing protein [Frankia sp. Cas4]|uniref:DUF2637 domain-containing protein n=1 Tax=Frankia sp. Cas4 TaxID=3073927 RepID=UPI002AD3B021|nr:DUF2637 domain-containing protein [Frankia sp. Cas4]
MIAGSQTAGQFERAAVTVLPLLLGAGVFAVAFVHVHDVAKWAGQPDWAAWLIACTGELMAIAAGAAILESRRVGAGRGWPVFVLVCAVVFSGACNFAAAGGGLAGEKPGVWVSVMAVWPVVAFGLVAGLKATRPVTATRNAEQPGETAERSAQPPDRAEHRPAPDERERDPAISSLLPDAMRIARRIAPNGTPPSGRALAQALRADGHPLAASRVRPLADAVAAEWASAGPTLIPVPSRPEVSP